MKKLCLFVLTFSTLLTIRAGDAGKVTWGDSSSKVRRQYGSALSSKKQHGTKTQEGYVTFAGQKSYMLTFFVGDKANRVSYWFKDGKVFDMLKGKLIKKYGKRYKTTEKPSGRKDGKKYVSLTWKLKRSTVTLKRSPGYLKNKDLLTNVVLDYYPSESVKKAELAGDDI